MSEPTTYDLIQDTRIQGVEDLVQTSYTPFQGPEFSYPVVHQPMDDEMWQYVTLGVGSGILDTGGFPYWLRELSDVTDTGKLTVDTTTGTAQAILRGFYHRLNQDMTLSFPPVSQKTVYHVVLEYDPLRHKEPGGPIRVRVLTSLDWSGGKHYLTLYRVTRDPSSLLTGATVERVRPRVAPTIYVRDETHKPDPEKQLWGTVCFVGNTGGQYRVASASEAGGSGETLEWVPFHALFHQVGYGITYGYPGHGSQKAIAREGQRRILRGRWSRPDGQTFSPSSYGYLLWKLEEQDRPASEERRVVSGYNLAAPNLGVVNITADGEVRFHPVTSTTWVDIGEISYTAAAS